MWCSSSESDGKTICRGWIDHSIHSVAVTASSLWSWLHSMYFQGKAERSLDNKSLQKPKCQEFQQTKLQITANRSRTRPMTLLWYFMYIQGKPLHGNIKPGSHMPPTYLGHAWDNCGICEHLSPTHNLSQALTTGLPAKLSWVQLRRQA